MLEYITQIKYKDVSNLFNVIYGDVSKWGRLRALPVADEASNKEWQRSKFVGAPSRNKFWAPQQDITGRTVRILFNCKTLF